MDLILSKIDNPDAPITEQTVTSTILTECVRTDFNNPMEIACKWFCPHGSIVESAVLRLSKADIAALVKMALDL